MMRSRCGDRPFFFDFFCLVILSHSFLCFFSPPNTTTKHCLQTLPAAAKKEMEMDTMTTTFESPNPKFVIDERVQVGHPSRQGCPDAPRKRTHPRVNHGREAWKTYEAFL